MEHIAERNVEWRREWGPEMPPCLNRIQQWGQAICNSESRTYRVSTFGIGYGVSAVARDVDASGNGSRGNETGISLSASLR